MLRRIFASTLTLALATAGMVVTASAASSAANTIGPNQYFGALVNGRNGVATPAPIQMACFGPLLPGHTGHPLAGQTIEVVRPVSTAGNLGFTDANGTSVVAFFGALPPTPAAATGGGTVTFKRYGVAKKIPKSLVLPCSGSGTVNFVPLPMSPPDSRIATVAVTYVSQP